MRRSKGFRPDCAELEGRIALSHAPHGLAEAALAAPAVSKNLKLDGTIRWGFPFRGIIVTGAPVVAIGLSGPHQTLTANGIRVQQGYIDEVESRPVATTSVSNGIDHLEFFNPSTMTLTTKKGVITFDTTPTVAGGNSLSYVVVSGTGKFVNAHGTGTLTFANLAKFHSNR